MAEYNPILSAPQGANKKPKRVGRGSSSGLGTTAGKGNKGQHVCQQYFIIPSQIKIKKLAQIKRYG